MSSGEAEVAARTKRALLAVLEGDFECAERELSAVARADSSDAVAYLALAQLYRERGEIGRALRLNQNLLLRADLRAEERGRVLQSLAADLHAGGYRTRAIAAYQQVLEVHPSSQEALDALVELYAEAEQHDEAISLLKRAAGWLRRADPRRMALLLTARARALRLAGKNDAARKDARRAMGRDASAAAPRLLLGEIEAERRRDKAALAAWSGAVGLEVEDPDGLWERIGASYAGLGRTAEFEAFARQRLAEVPADRAAARALAQALVASGQVDDALEQLRALLEVDPCDTRTRAQLGRLLLSERRETDALEAYEESIEAVAPFQPSGSASDTEEAS